MQALYVHERHKYYWTRVSNRVNRVIDANAHIEVNIRDFDPPVIKGFKIPDELILRAYISRYLPIIQALKLEYYTLTEKR